MTAFKPNRSWSIWFHQLHWHFKWLLSAKAAQDCKMKICKSQISDAATVPLNRWKTILQNIKVWKELYMSLIAFACKFFLAYKPNSLPDSVFLPLSPPGKKEAHTMILVFIVDTDRLTICHFTELESKVWNIEIASSLPPIMQTWVWAENKVPGSPTVEDSSKLKTEIRKDLEKFIGDRETPYCVGIFWWQRVVRALWPIWGRPQPLSKRS